GARLILSGVAVNAIRAAIGVSYVGRAIRKEDSIEEIIVGKGPVALVIGVGPERIIKHVRVGVRPEDRPRPRYESRARFMPPRFGRSPMLSPDLHPLIPMGGVAKELARKAVL